MGAFMKSGDSNGEHRQGHGEEEIETVKKKKSDVWHYAHDTP